MSKVMIYGASDDLVEVEGDIREEFNPPYGDDEGPSYLAFSDGTVLSIAYSEGGTRLWRINRVAEGTAKYEKQEATGPDADYSDHVTLTDEFGDGFAWVVFGQGLARRAELSR